MLQSKFVQKITISNIECNEENPLLVSDQTKPPRRYSESSIVQEMKKQGIGRPSTYVSTIQTLSRRKYVENSSGALIPTDAAKTLWLEVVPFYNEQNDKGLFAAQFTAKMEADLDTIRSINLSVNEGEKVAILGRNGSGKSTLVDLLMGLLTPSSGEIYIDNININDDISSWQRKIGYVPQNIFLIDD